LNKPILATLALVTVLSPGRALAQPIAYVTNQASNVVHMLRTTDWANLGTIPVGNAPTGIAIPTSGGFALVANKGGNSVSRVDLATSTVVATIPVPGNPTAVAVTPDGAKAYVVQSTNCPALPAPTTPPGPTPSPDPAPTPSPAPRCTLAVIDTATNAIVATVTVGHDPFAVAMSSSGGFAYVTNRSDDTVTVIDTSTDTTIDELSVGDTPEGIATGQGLVYVANDASNAVSVYREIDFQPLTTVPVGASPLAVAVSPDGRTAVVGNDQDGSVSLIETGAEVVFGTSPVGTNPTGLAITPDSRVAVVANSTSGTVSIVQLAGNPPGPTQTVTLLGSPAAVAITPAPFFALEMRAVPGVVAAGATVVYEIDYLNLGSGPGVATTLVDEFQPELTFVSASGGGALLGGDVVWDLGTVAVGASASVEATFNVASAPPLLDGDEITSTATIADAIGNATSTSLTIGTRVPGGLGLVQGNYVRKDFSGPTGRDTWRIKAQIPALAGGFDNDQPITVTWSTPSELVSSFTIPLGAWTGKSGRNRWRFSGDDLAGPGTKVRGQLALRGSGTAARWHFNLTVSHATLPVIADTSAITVSAAFDVDVYSSTREFRIRKTSRPGLQRLSYRSVIVGD
jgi:YVTN family beta-propeller protein